MKKIFTRSNFWPGLIGLIIGVGVSMVIFSALVPSGADMIRIYHLEKNAQANNSTGDLVINGTSTTDHSAPSHTGTSNPYVMGKVTTEKQFLQRMELHHEAAVIMANEALRLKLRPEVKTLANNIISTQTTEIKMMKDWIAAWWK